MCFSAEVSFTSSILLAVIGYGALKETKSSKEKILALIPFFFALQQLAEGFIWTLLEGTTYTVQGFFTEMSLLTGAAYLYLFFAYVFWPLWIPIAFLAIEPLMLRRKWQAACLLAGILSASIAIGAFFHADGIINITAVNKSLQYTPGELLPPFLYYLIQVLYITAVIGPSLLSSLPRMWWFGVLIAITFLLASYFYWVMFASVWCFFSAIASGSIFIILRERKKS